MYASVIIFVVGFLLVHPFLAFSYRHILFRRDVYLAFYLSKITCIGLTVQFSVSFIPGPSVYHTALYLVFILLDFCIARFACQCLLFILLGFSIARPAWQSRLTMLLPVGGRVCVPSCSFFSFLFAVHAAPRMFTLFIPFSPQSVPHRYS